MMRPSAILPILACLAWSQSADLVSVISKPVSRTVDFPGEIQPYLRVAVHAKVQGFVEKIPVDRGTALKEGDLIAELSAPEIAAQIAEAESKVQAVAATRRKPRPSLPPRKPLTTASAKPTRPPAPWPASRWCRRRSRWTPRRRWSTRAIRPSMPPSLRPIPFAPCRPI